MIGRPSSIKDDAIFTYPSRTLPISILNKGNWHGPLNYSMLCPALHELEFVNEYFQLSLWQNTNVSNSNILCSPNLDFEAPMERSTKITIFWVILVTYKYFISTHCLQNNGKSEYMAPHQRHHSTTFWCTHLPTAVLHSITAILAWNYYPGTFVAKQCFFAF
jgi:hypothetical protein